MPTISIGFQIQNQGNGFQDLILDAGKFKKLLAQTVTEAEKVKNKMVSFGSISIGLDALSTAVQQLQGFTKEFTAAYDAQMEAERQLEQVMKNTMDARAEDIQSIKDFCSAQQEIGIVGDEVQLAGAQADQVAEGQDGGLRRHNARSGLRPGRWMRGAWMDCD